MSSTSIYTSCLFLIFVFKQIGAGELTFELPDNAKECFHEKLKIGSKFSLEFQVCYRNLIFYFI
jgi:hypothetical protein